MEEFDVFYESATSDEGEDEQPNYLKKRYIRDYANPLEHYADHEFSRRYRFTKAVVIDVLLPLAREKLEKHCNRGLPVPPLIQLLTALRFYPSNSFQMVHGDLRWLSQASVSRIVKNVSITFTEQLQQFICFPRSDTGSRQNTAKFYTIAHFPSVVGCLDCTHIPISNPGGENAEVFRCRKGYFSLNVQAICGPNMEIMNIVVRHPGSTHDSVVFDRSAVAARFEAGEFRSVLLGDNGYPCRKYLLTSILYPSDEQEIHYNNAHIKTRNIIERVFGVWKRRFPCLQNGLRTGLKSTLAIICSCAVLYNIGLRHNENNILDPNVVCDGVEGGSVYVNSNEGNSQSNSNSQFAVRRTFVNTYF